MVNVMATFGQLERRVIGQSTRDALAAKRAAGVRLGRPSTLPTGVVERWYPATVGKVAHGQDAAKLST
jgi:DNA invertase Pin-like site-specific DNA recombinase